MKRSGIKDVAAAAGVSVATASLVLSGTGRPSEAARKRVLEVADALGFIRDASAARLRTGESNLVDVILNNIVNPFFSELVASLEVTIYEAGSLTLLATVQNDLVRQERLLASMMAQGVGSVILSPVHGSFTLCRLSLDKLRQDRDCRLERRRPLLGEFADGLCHAVHLQLPQHDDGVAGGERGNRDLLDIGAQHVVVHCTIDDESSGHFGQLGRAG